MVLSNDMQDFIWRSFGANNVWGVEDQATRVPDLNEILNKFTESAGGGGNAPGFSMPELPNILQGEGPMPTEGWYEGLDENVRAGIERPYDIALDKLTEQLAGEGVLGTARSGTGGPAISGAGAKVLGTMAQEAAPVMAKSAWEMMLPGMMMPYQTALTQYTTEADLSGRKYATEMERYLTERGQNIGKQTSSLEASMQDYLARLQNSFSTQQEGDDAWAEELRKWGQYARIPKSSSIYADWKQMYPGQEARNRMSNLFSF